MDAPSARRCFCAETLCGRFRWLLAGWVLLLGGIGAAVGSTGLLVAAVLPAGVCAFALVVTWHWQRLYQPWAEGRPGLVRWVLVAAAALHWTGWFWLMLPDGGDLDPKRSPPTPVRYRLFVVVSLPLVAKTLPSP